MYDYLTDENWKKLFEKHPGLEGDMATISNANELAFLRHELAHDLIVPSLYPGRKAWVIKRIQELEQVVHDKDIRNVYDDLWKLAGMAHAQGEYTPEEWIKKTGVDPRDWPGLIIVNDKGRCTWTQKAELIYSKYSDQIDANWKALGMS